MERNGAKVSKEAMDWATEEIERIKAWQEANPDWQEKSITLDEFRKKYGLPPRQLIRKHAEEL